MEPFVIELPDEVKQLSGMKELSGTLGETSYRSGAETFETPNGVDYALTLTNTGEGILLQGTVDTEAHGRCARCLKPVALDISGGVEGYYLLDPADGAEGYERDEIDFVSEKGTIDLAGPIEAALVYSTPYVVLCNEDCKGLCPRCGADLNDGPCDCQDDEAEEDNPFAVLKNLHFDENGKLE